MLANTLTTIITLMLLATKENELIRAISDIYRDASYPSKFGWAMAYQAHTGVTTTEADARASEAWGHPTTSVFGNMLRKRRLFRDLNEEFRDIEYPRPAEWMRAYHLRSGECYNLSQDAYRMAFSTPDELVQILNKKYRDFKYASKASWMADYCNVNNDASIEEVKALATQQFEEVSC
jgi:hypothetical protein